MKADDFEQWLQRQPLRPVPGEWRQEILATARREAILHHASRITHHRPGPFTLSSRLSAIFWPCPQAWAGLAALWLVILAINFASADESDTLAKKTPAPSLEMITAFKEQQRLLAELLGPLQLPSAERPKPLVPRPHSERQRPGLRLGASHSDAMKVAVGFSPRFAPAREPSRRGATPKGKFLARHDSGVAPRRFACERIRGLIPAATFEHHSVMPT